QEKRRVTLHFRLWDRQSWVINHPDHYHHLTTERAINGYRQFDEPQYFLEFLDQTEKLFWFGDLIKYRLLQKETVNRISPEHEQHRNEMLEQLHLSYGLDCSRGGLLAPRLDFAHFLNKATIR